MNFSLILATVLLLGVAGWLWHLSKAQKTYISLEASLTPVPNVTSTSLLKPSAFNICYKKAVAIITKIFPFVVLIGLILGLAGSIYLISLIIKKYAWTSSIIVEIVILVLVLAFSALLLKKYKQKELEKKILIRYPNSANLELSSLSKEDVEGMLNDSISSLSSCKKIIEYAGEAILPKKVYLNDSHSISINLKPIIPRFSTLRSEEPLRIQDSKSGKSIILQIQRDSSLEQFLEIQLLAAGLIVDGEKIQRQSLTLPTLSYCWNCYSPNSGDHEISLIIRVVSQPVTIELGAIQHSIKVAQLDHLTQRQVQWAGIITGWIGIAVLLQQLGVLQKIVSYALQ